MYICSFVNKWRPNINDPKEIWLDVENLEVSAQFDKENVNPTLKMFCLALK